MAACLHLVLKDVAVADLAWCFFNLHFSWESWFFLTSWTMPMYILPSWMNQERCHHLQILGMAKTFCRYITEKMAETVKVLSIREPPSLDLLSQTMRGYFHPTRQMAYRADGHHRHQKGAGSLAILAALGERDRAKGSFLFTQTGENHRSPLRISRVCQLLYKVKKHLLEHVIEEKRREEKPIPNFLNWGTMPTWERLTQEQVQEA